MNTTHSTQVTTEALNKWAKEKMIVFASAYGNGLNKFLWVTLDGRYIVESHREYIYEGTDADKAVESYNSI